MKVATKSFTPSYGLHVGVGQPFHVPKNPFIHPADESNEGILPGFAPSSLHERPCTHCLLTLLKTFLLNN